VTTRILSNRPFAELRTRHQDGRVSVVEPPDGLVVSINEAKLNTRVLFPGESDPMGGAEDSSIERMIQAATQEIDAPDGWLGRSLLTRTLRLSLDAQPPSVVQLPGPPVTEVTAVKYRDAAGDEHEMDPADYRVDLDAEPALIWPREAWPVIAAEPGSMKIEYVAGYGAAEDVPALIQQWVLIRVGDLYRDREGSVIGTITSQLTHVQRMLDNLRVR